MTLRKEIDCLKRIAAIDGSILPRYLAYGEYRKSWVLISQQCANCEHPSFKYCLQQRFTPQTFIDRILYTLSVLDRAGVVHGDLKLSNLLVTASGDIVVIDFSGSAIGKRVASDANSFEGVSVTAKDITCFTTNLHAPELASVNDIVTNADMYSAGKILKEVYDAEYWPIDTECMRNSNDCALTCIDEPRSVRSCTAHDTRCPRKTFTLITVYKAKCNSEAHS